MANAVTNPNAAGLAALASLRSGLQLVRTTISSADSGQPLLRLLKDGAWVMGREDSAIGADAEALVNPLSFLSGYSCWTNRKPGEGKNEIMGEEMWGLNDMRPPASTLPEHHDPRTQELCQWREQMSVDVKFLAGKYEGQQAVYKVSSVGGKRALAELLDAIMLQIDRGSEYVIPIITIGSDSYQHASYGRTYVPKLTIVGWFDNAGKEIDVDGNAVDAELKIERAPEPKAEPKVLPKPEPEAEAPAAPAGRRRRV